MIGRENASALRRAQCGPAKSVIVAVGRSGW
jgi:hypothetical protein